MKAEVKSSGGKVHEVAAPKPRVFEKTLKRRAYEDVVEQIERAILVGELKEQDRLPAERDLTMQFGVSRATIREALRVLQSRGLVEVRHGDPAGPIVRANPGASVTSVLSSLFRAKRLTLADVVQFRMIIEGAAAAYAAKASKKAIAAIREAYRQMETTTTWEEQIRCDVLFHRRVAEATGNPLFALVVDALHQFNSIATWQSKRPLDQARRETLEVHGMILRAIEAGNAAEAEEFSRYHLGRSYQPIIDVVDRDRLTLAMPHWKDK
jgi:DNA-binding FadR family transcriptional regulator